MACTSDLRQMHYLHGHGPSLSLRTVGLHSEQKALLDMMVLVQSRRYVGTLRPSFSCFTKDLKNLPNRGSAYSTTVKFGKFPPSVSDFPRPDTQQGMMWCASHLVSVCRHAQISAHTADLPSKGLSGHVWACGETLKRQMISST